MISPVKHDRTSVIVDTVRSPTRAFMPVPITAVTLEDEFWRRRRQINRDVMLPAQYDLCERTAALPIFAGQP